MSKIVFLGLLTFSFVLADIPNTFVSGGVAKAIEINENFTYLDNKIDSLENNASIVTGYDFCPNKHTVTYQKKVALVGDIITLGTIKYTVIAVPFKEFGTGDHYYLKIPVDLARTYYHNFSFKHKESTLGLPADLYISNYPVKVTFIQDSWQINISKNNSTNFLSLTQKYRVFGYLNICINETSIELSSPQYIEEVQQIIENIPLTETDFTKYINYNNFDHNDTLLQTFDDWIDYIEIIKVN